MKNNTEAIKINPLAELRSLSLNPGLINFHISSKTYGNATIKPAVIEVQTCAENWPPIVLLWILKGSSVKQKLSLKPTNWAILQSIL